ncbi:MAG: Hsp33 family molecular chaperone HslO [Eubacterium sp.]|nr:Hsp33 family molecular chaperone HslO [Eubacterium sp.]
MEDYLVRATAAGETVRAFAVRSTEIAATARELHHTYPVVTAALGRLLSAGAMMGSMMKGENDKLTLQITGDGPIGQMTVTVDSHGNVKGFPEHPDVDIPLKYVENGTGKLNVGAAVGKGILTVSMDLGLAEPYNGQVEIQTGEIGDDIAYYFTVSEQTPSVVGLGVMVDTDSTVKHSGGYIIQVMPNASEETISAIESKVSTADPVTTMLDKGMSPEEILEYFLGDFDLEILEKEPVRFHCDCSRERVAGALATISRKDLESIINDGEEIEVKCHFCNSAYKFTVDEVRAMLEKSKTEKQNADTGREA